VTQVLIVIRRILPVLTLFNVPGHTLAIDGNQGFLLL
jgi:hypothetical protein